MASFRPETPAQSGYLAQCNHKESQLSLQLNHVLNLQYLLVILGDCSEGFEHDTLCCARDSPLNPFFGRWYPLVDVVSAPPEHHVQKDHDNDSKRAKCCVSMCNL